MTATRTIKALVFDFDGTLADSMLLVLPVYNRVAARLGLPHVLESEIPTLRRMGPRKAIEQYAVPLWKIPVLLHQVRREMEQEGTVPPLFTELGSVFQASALGSLRRFILSSNSQRNVEQFLRLHKIDGFERIDCGASLFGKGRRLRRLLQVSRLEPSEVAYVGDEQRDVEAAREVGAMSIAVSWGYAERESLVTENPSFIVDRPRELIDVLERVAAGPVACR